MMNEDVIKFMDMKKWNVVLVVVLAVLTLNGFAKAPGVKGVKHVVLIGLDGWGAYSVPKANMPNVKALMEKGAYTLESRSILPSSSAPNWAAMFMGVGPELHGYTTWGSKTPEIPSRVILKNGIFPTVFQVVRDARPDAEIGVFSEWLGIKYLIDTLSVSVYENTPDYNKYPTALCETAVKYIREKKPVLAAFCFDNPDHVGHQSGHDTPAYYEKLKELDGYIGQILKAAKEAGIYDETIFIVTADHGGINKGHGGKTLQEMQVPFIICGKGVKAGHRIESSMMQFDTAATIAYILGVKAPQVWIGRPVTEVFN